MTPEARRWFTEKYLPEFTDVHHLNIGDGWCADAWRHHARIALEGLNFEIWLNRHIPVQYALGPPRMKSEYYSTCELAIEAGVQHAWRQREG